MIEVDSWTVQELQSQSNSGTLIVSPEFQRRGVWNQKAKMLLADSVARAVPIGAITLYADDSQGFNVYEVIDGKQRITSILDFLAGDFVIKTTAVESAALDDDEFDSLDAVTADCHNVEFSEIPQRRKMSIMQYKIPIFIVRGERSSAIRSFTRMNQSSYSLKPQEIRNAFFNDSEYLKASIRAAQELDSLVGEDGQPFFVSMGVMSNDSYLRMQDIQLMSELILLCLNGPQHRRDRLDEAYETYRKPSGAAAKALNSASNRVISILTQLQSITGAVPLQALHFPKACEHDVYGLFGALVERELNAPQLTNLQSELLEVISGFRRQVTIFIAQVREGQITSEEFGDLVEQYGRGFLGGQVNSRDRRKTRIQIWTNVINGVVQTLDPSSGFSETQRRLIWARSEDKRCARCNNVVEWSEFHAGHKLAHSLGGRTEVDNGQVEHASCNQTAGAV